MAILAESQPLEHWRMVPPAEWWVIWHLGESFALTLVQSILCQSRPRWQVSFRKVLLSVRLWILSKVSICDLNPVCITTWSHEIISEIPQVLPGPNLFNGLHIRLLIFSNPANCIGIRWLRYDLVFRKRLCWINRKMITVGIHFRVGLDLSPRVVH